MKIGIDIGGSHIGVGLIQEDKIVDFMEKNLTRDDRHNIENVILNTCYDFIDVLVKRNNIENIELIGIAVPGNISNGIIMKAGNLGLNNFDIVSKFKERYDIPIQVKNDAKCAGLAEMKFGSMKGFKDAVFLCLGTGIGGAVFLDGKLLKDGSDFEIGHMIINKEGRQCTCGKRGCFETYASIRAFKLKVAEVLDIDSDFSGQYLRENLLDLNNEKIMEVVNQFLEDLVVGLSNVIDIFGPEIISLGGSFSYYENHPVYLALLDKIKEPGKVRSDILPEIRLGELKNNAGIIGATL